MIVTTGYKIRKLKHGDELIIRDVWGAIEYKGEGVFIAGGAGVTPFIAILRQLQADDKLLTTN
jgi:predicted ferric reductase